MEREKAIEMIQKLIRLQESPNENEAALAAAKASELLIKYNLTMSDVVEEGSDAEMTEIRADFHNTVLRPWMNTLAVRIAQYTFCKVYYNRNWDKDWEKDHRRKPTLYYFFTFFGRRANAEVASYLYDQLATKLRELSFKAEKEDKKLHPWKTGNDMRDFRASYMFGASVAISNKLLEMRRSLTPDEKAIVLVRDEEVEKAWEIRTADFKKRKSVRSVKIINSAYIRGFEDGKSIDVHDGLKGS